MGVSEPAPAGLDDTLAALADPAVLGQPIVATGWA
jgi:hypothetical protein